MMSWLDEIAKARGNDGNEAGLVKARLEEQKKAYLQLDPLVLRLLNELSIAFWGAGVASAKNSIAYHDDDGRPKLEGYSWTLHRSTASLNSWSVHLVFAPALHFRIRSRGKTWSTEGVSESDLQEALLLAARWAVEETKGKQERQVE